MKKILLMALLLSSITYAQTTQYIKIGANQHKIEENTGTGIAIGWGVTKTTQNNLLLGVDFNLDYASDIEGKSFSAYSGDVKLGYAFFNQKLGVYAIGSAMQQSYVNTGYGFGYGGGVSYKLLDSLSIICEYKTYSMTNTASTYDYDSLGGYLQYNF